MNDNVLGTDWLEVNSIIEKGGMKLVDQDCEKAYLGLTIIPNICSNGKPVTVRPQMSL